MTSSDLWAGPPKIRGFPSPPMSFELAHCSHSQRTEAAPTTRTWGSDVVLTPAGWCPSSDSTHDWTLLRPLYKLKIGSVSVERERSTHLAATWDKPICKFPCLPNLPPTNLEWPAFFFEALAYKGSDLKVRSASNMQPSEPSTLHWPF